MFELSSRQSCGENFSIAASEFVLEVHLSIMNGRSCVEATKGAPASHTDCYLIFESENLAWWKARMNAKLLYENNGLRTFVIVFDKNDDVRQKLLEFAGTNRFTDAHLSAIGAFSEVKLGFFDRQQKTYKPIPIQEQVEVLSLLGNIVQSDGKPALHAHIVVGKSDGTAHGGHFLEGKVWPTLEMVISEMPAQLRRTQDKETGLPLINLAA